MFSAKSYGFFVAAAILVTLGFLCMAYDPTPAGLGVWTLWVAPPLLLFGLFLPIPGILGIENGELLTLRAQTILKPKNLFALGTFLVAFSIYLLTLEPTASLWDCSEFIASAYKLEVPHTPGTPLSLLFGRIFSMLAFDSRHVAWTINLMSAFFSALSVALVYLIIHHFGEKIINPTHQQRNGLLIVASLGGCLCLAFSDTFWFTAVEAETYGIACFYLLMIILLILKGPSFPVATRSRILILIGYLSGLAYCIHPMCLLVLPLLPFVWYTFEKPITWRNTIVTVFSGLVLVFSINRFLAIGLSDLMFKADLFTVNTLGLPFYSGVILALSVVAIGFYILWSVLRPYRTYVWSLLFLLAGFTPYLMLFIRSNQNPSIDETNPEDLYQIRAYMNRESYGSSPLFYGPYFDARIEDVVSNGKAYYKDTSSYKVAGSRVDYEFENSRETILPRLYSRDVNHIQAYRQWLGLRESEVPTFAHNLEFLFTYQIGHMYLRYLMWNFVGREGDVQDSGWLKPWDRLSTGSTERSRNQYWMIPLLLGIVGAWTQFRRDRKGFAANGTFFLFTGLVLAVYLNSPPIEPRERDYIYVASYIAFCIWIGLGLLTWQPAFLKTTKHMVVAGLGVLVLPLWMLSQNFDDHDRSGRTLQIDYARAVLNSCAPNSILFTGGDNDTFPLWYLQEVEGHRTDVRVMVLSYFNTDWYINQLRRPSYLSPPLQFTLSPENYRQYGMNDVLYLEEKIKSGIDVQQYLALLRDDHPALRMTGSTGDSYHILPSRTLTIKSNNDADGDLSIQVTGNYLEKNALAILDLFISNEDRPLHFNVTAMNSLSMDLQPYLIQEGLVYRLTHTRFGEEPGVDTEVTFHQLIESLDLTNLADPRVNFNYEDYFARIVVPLRQSFNALAEACMQQGDPARAEKVLTASLDRLHFAHLPPSYTDLATAEMLTALGQKDRAKALAFIAFNYYYERVNNSLMQEARPDRLDVYLLRQTTALLTNLGDSTSFEKFDRLSL